MLKIIQMKMKMMEMSMAIILKFDEILNFIPSVVWHYLVFLFKLDMLYSS